ncbi:DUF134 domain-containing protein [Patescibacteria group bacterium]|nr:DUF134 domain-containing protein [Patescibacteria group bacterium]MBU1705106.1 DUF134 domain-containing protein [Patescibacteria group bacterium]
MARPKIRRRIQFQPKVLIFKPEGTSPARLQTVKLADDELEALRLKYVEGWEQTQCARAMQVSQSTFQRILQSANEKVSQALVQGKAIKLLGSK